MISVNSSSKQFQYTDHPKKSRGVKKQVLSNNSKKGKEKEKKSPTHFAGTFALQLSPTGTRNSLRAGKISIKNQEDQKSSPKIVMKDKYLNSTQTELSLKQLDNVDLPKAKKTNISIKNQEDQNSSLKMVMKDEYLKSAQTELSLTQLDFLTQPDNVDLPKEKKINLSFKYRNNKQNTTFEKFSFDTADLQYLAKNDPQKELPLKDTSLTRNNSPGESNDQISVFDLSSLQKHISKKQRKHKDPKDHALDVKKSSQQENTTSIKEDSQIILNSDTSKKKGPFPFSQIIDPSDKQVSKGEKILLTDHITPPENQPGKVIMKENAANPFHTRPPSSDKLLQQILPRFSAHIENNGQNLVIDLHPEYLGKLHINLEIKESLLNAHFIAENSLAQQLIKENLPLLRASLANQGVHIDQVSVSLGQHRNDQDNQFSNHQQKKKKGAGKLPFSRSPESGPIEIINNSDRTNYLA